MSGFWSKEKKRSKLVGEQKRKEKSCHSGERGESQPRGINEKEKGNERKKIEFVFSFLFFWSFYFGN